MSDTIYRQAAIDALCIVGCGSKYCGISCEEVMAIETLPSAQPEVVRCKDCKWYDIAHPYGSVITDVFHCKINGRFFEASHFCGYGERRE